MPKDLLYEIGVEEIPAGFVLPALKELEERLRSGLADLRLDCGEITTCGTPRRLAVLARDVSDGQPDVEREYKGPPADKAFDAEGRPTKAAEGFARTRGIAVEDLQVVETDKGKWVCAKVLEKGMPAEEVLPGLLEEATLGLSFPKTMRWASLDLRFARPIRWLVALLGETVLDLTVAGVKATNVTRSHRFLGAGEIILGSPGQYVEALREGFVLADHHERKEAIRASAVRVAAEVGGRARMDEGLLTEVAFLVEWPTCLWGRFDERYLDLPEPVIVTVMQGHQRYFPVEDDQGRLMPYFIAVRNGEEEGVETVRQGNEKVIVPRLDDAEFYLTEDMKQPLEERAASLSRVTFMEGLGTLADKTARLERLVEWLAQRAAGDGLAEAREVALRAAHLAKADLVTLMVGDSKLGELQGVVGGEYAARQGESPAVAAAIAEHYRPRGAGDTIPDSPAGLLVSLADKMDNLAACFRLGAVPSGSADPFALRRQAQGVVDMLLARGLRLDLPALVRTALELIPEPQLEREKDAQRVLGVEQAAEALLGFFSQRLDHALTRDGVTYDVARAVLGAPWSDPWEAFQRGKFLQGLREQDAVLFDTLVTSGERPARITRPEDLPDTLAVNPALFSDEWESRLHQCAATAATALETALDGGARDYPAAVEALTALAEPIHGFFEDVMVMVEDYGIRHNRLALLREIDRLFLRLADFLQIVREG